MSRPTGATLLAILFAWLGIAGVLNAILWPLAYFGVIGRLPEALFVRSPLLPVLALGYGISSLAFARGLWGLKAWMRRAYAVWLGWLALLSVFFVWQLPPSGNIVAQTVDLAFGAIALLVLLSFPWLYTTRLLLESESRTPP